MPSTIIHTLRASGGDYTTISAWEAAQQRDLVAVDEVAVLECYNDWVGGLNDSVEINGWTTDATRNVIIRCADGHRHDGTPNSGFHINYVGFFNSALTCVANYTYIDGLDIVITGNGTIAITISGTGTVVSNCLVSAVRHGVAFSYYYTNPTPYPLIKNSLAYGGGQSGYWGVGADSWQNYRIYNCTVANWSGNGIIDAHGGNHTIQNCVTHNCTVSYTTAGTATLTASNNAASDATTTAPLGTSPLLLDIVDGDFLDVLVNDYHLASGSQLIDGGADLTGIVDYDIDGAARAVPFDIGFDELGATVPVVITVLDQTSKLPVQNAHVYLYDSSFTEVLSGNTDVNGEYSTTVPIVTTFTANGWVRQYDLLSIDYKQSDITVQVTAFGAQTTVLLIRET